MIWKERYKQKLMTLSFYYNDSQVYVGITLLWIWNISVSFYPAQIH